MEGCRRTGRPRMLMYRKISSPSVALDDRAVVLDRLDQLEKLDRYVQRWFIGEDGSYVGAFHEFADAEQLETMAPLHLRRLVDRWLEGGRSVRLSGPVPATESAGSHRYAGRTPRRGGPS